MDSQHKFGGALVLTGWSRLAALCCLLCILCSLPFPQSCYSSSGVSVRNAWPYSLLEATAAELRGTSSSAPPASMEHTDTTSHGTREYSSAKLAENTNTAVPVDHRDPQEEQTAEKTTENSETVESDVQKEIHSDVSSAAEEGTHEIPDDRPSKGPGQEELTAQHPPSLSQEEDIDDIQERGETPLEEYEQWVTAYDIPEQLRRRIEGDDPLYYNLVIEERLYLMEPPVGAYREQRDESPESDEISPAEEPSHVDSAEQYAQKNGVYAMCYARNEDEIWQRCAAASEAAEGVYIQMHEMMDFGRLVDPDEVDPSTVTASLSEDHYQRTLRDLGTSWFAAIKEMKAATGLRVAGIWFGPPDFDKIDAVLKENPGVFEGVYVDWEDGVGACVDKIERPPRTTTKGEPTWWADKPDFFFRYYMGGQDASTCLLQDMSPYSFDSYVRADREMKIPEEWVPSFPCFAGHQGRCYRAFRANIAASCDAAQQRFIFAPYERTSDKLLTMFREGCKAVGYGVPPHDVVQFV
ncbi:hypothetical protein BESB_043480 [Besnoitia besnoiti]|uniref:Uncharacterized protein n=1 Tax=Besnoitia besnoiti TaxID=94643 RepID=A0A2A9MJL2_BESBE|nr:hypothetical protein BESB_043480 [Besnoitia besnoiti]PFH36156.1 hypothetical protein BESB_043480 [Besnoitia besnoiti]